MLLGVQEMWHVINVPFNAQRMQNLPYGTRRYPVFFSPEHRSNHCNDDAFSETPTVVLHPCVGSCRAFYPSSGGAQKTAHSGHPVALAVGLGDTRS